MPLRCHPAILRAVLGRRCALCSGLGITLPLAQNGVFSCKHLRGVPLHWLYAFIPNTAFSPHVFPIIDLKTQPCPLLSLLLWLICRQNMSWSDIFRNVLLHYFVVLFVSLSRMQVPCHQNMFTVSLFIFLLLNSEDQISAWSTVEARWVFVVSVPEYALNTQAVVWFGCLPTTRREKTVRRYFLYEAVKCWASRLWFIFASVWYLEILPSLQFPVPLQARTAFHLSWQRLFWGLAKPGATELTDKHWESPGHPPFSGFITPGAIS